MISYNHGKYIAQAIESILAQEADFSFELVIGDDFSRDDTVSICESFAERDLRVRLLERQPNMGVMLNFTRTLAACKGQYIAVCEGDDYWTDPRKLAKQVDFLDRNLDYAGAAHQSEVLINDCCVRKFKTGIPTTLNEEDLIGGRLFHTASILFRRSVVDLFCQAPQVLSCDRLLNFLIAFTGKIYFCNQSMCVYRIHGGGMSSNVTVSQLKLDLGCIDYLKSLRPTFPSCQYRSYVYATIGLCTLATPVQKIGYLTLSIIYSFANFPYNLYDYSMYLFRAAKRRMLRG